MRKGSNSIFEGARPYIITYLVPPLSSSISVLISFWSMACLTWHYTVDEVEITAWCTIGPPLGEDLRLGKWEGFSRPTYPGEKSLQCRPKMGKQWKQGRRVNYFLPKLWFSQVFIPLYSNAFVWIACLRLIWGNSARYLFYSRAAVVELSEWGAVDLRLYWCLTWVHQYQMKKAHVKTDSRGRSSYVWNTKSIPSILNAWVLGHGSVDFIAM